MNPKPGHGRIETRKYTNVSEIDWLQGKENWSRLKTIIMVESERTPSKSRRLAPSVDSGWCAAERVLIYF
ncbi:MAG: hypothetical protein LWX54_09585 [Deltaproteobacteria bacterium]|nr:hypothetical protein [Deltaproteobacteria bacterium]